MGLRKSQTVAILALCAFLSSLWSINYSQTAVVVPESTLPWTPEAIAEQQPAVDDPGMAACLLVMDDNHFLVEWLAYHYHVLPLRHLIIAVDPRSRTSPASILDRWRSLINITLWTDADYYFDHPNGNDNDSINDNNNNGNERTQAEYWASRKFGADKPQSLIQHRARQRLFYYHCLRDFKAAGRQWTLLTDSDEFLRVNHRRFATMAGSVWRTLRADVPEWRNVTQRACIQIPRIRFGAVVSASDNTTQTRYGLDPTVFSTLHFRHHAGPGNFPINRISKVVVNLRKVAWDDLVPVESIHLPLPTHCRRRQLHVRTHQHPLVLHHYLGTWEQYAARDDARAGVGRSRQEYEKVAHIDQATDDEITPWIDGFVEYHGKDAAHWLLEGAGQVDWPDAAAH